MRDPYEVLEVSRDAPPEDIKSAYRRLARRYHPDVNPGDRDAEERFKEIGQAYAILSDDERRARFDRFGTTEDHVPVDFGAGFADLFDVFFGASPDARTRRGRGRDGDDARADVELSLSDVVTGAERDVRYQRLARCKACDGSGSEGGAPAVRCTRCGGAGVITQMRNTILGSLRTTVTCSACGGAGEIVETRCKACRGEGLVVEQASRTVRIPAGVDSGVTIRVPGAGGEGIGAGSAGDLYVVLHLRSDPRFMREGQNLVSKITLSFHQAALGDTIDVEGVDQDFEVTVPAGAQPGDVLRIEGAGLPPVHGGRRGDLLLEVQVEVPRDLSPAEEDLIRQLAELRQGRAPRGADDSGLLGGLFGKARKRK